MQTNCTLGPMSGVGYSFGYELPCPFIAAVYVRGLLSALMNRPAEHQFGLKGQSIVKEAWIIVNCFDRKKDLLATIPSQRL